MYNSIILTLNISIILVLQGLLYSAHQKKCIIYIYIYIYIYIMYVYKGYSKKFYNWKKFDTMKL